MQRLCAATVILLLFVVFPLFSQTSSTAVLGTVTDASGAVVVGAKVTLLQVQTGIKRQDTTSSTGDFNFPLLDPGEYSVTVEAPGFKRATNSGIQLELDLKARIAAVNVCSRNYLDLIQKYGVDFVRRANRKIIDDFPDRAEFFYGQCGCNGGGAPGPSGLATDLNFQQFSVDAQYAVTNRIAVFGTLPARFIQPQSFFAPAIAGSFGNQSGESICELISLRV